ncbi:marine proteobacterial sortase target protein [Sessilibacter sp. MAH2]
MISFLLLNLVRLICWFIYRCLQKHKSATLISSKLIAINMALNDYPPLGYKPKKFPKHMLLDHKPRKRKRDLFLKLFLLIIFITLTSIFFAKVARAAIPEQYQESPQLLFKNDSNGFQTSVHLKTEVNTRITGLVGTTTVRQTFKNESSNWQEGLYVFPLPEDSAVTDLAIFTNDRKIVAEIHEKIEARHKYEVAKKEGKKAALLEQQKPNLFVQAVSNIPPNENIDVEITFYQIIPFRNGEFEYRLPTTMTPRYSPRQNGTPTNLEVDTKVNLEKGAGANLPQVLSFENQDFIPTPRFSTQLENPMKFSIEIEAGLNLSDIEVLFHEIEIERMQSIYKITAKDEWIPMNRDLVLTWKPQITDTPQAAFVTDIVNNENFGLLMLVPPSEIVETIPRSVSFIIDTSGSMGGASINQAKNALNLALSRLKPTDKFNIIEFNSVTRALYSHPVFADSRNIQQAIQFVSTLDANGGTEMRPALEVALNATSEEKYLRQIVFITDGAVTNEQELLKLIYERLDQARLFTVAIGSAPNGYFMKKSAKFGRGSYIHIGDITQVNTQMQKLFKKLESAALQNIQINWPDHVEVWPQKITDLYKDEPLVVAIKSTKQGILSAENVDVHGYFSDGTLWQSQIILDFNRNKPKRTGIDKLWAKEKVEDLMDQIIVGKPEATIKPEVIELGLKHNLVTAYTSLLAIETEISRPVAAPLYTSAVPLDTPAGLKLTQVPQTDTRTNLFILLGLILSITSLLLRNFNRKNSEVLSC